MHYEEWGNGERTVVLLHGWSGDHRTAAPLLPLLPEGTRLIAFDLPGVGRSPAPAAWSAAAIGERLLEALRAVGDPELTVVGNCSGANLLLPVIDRLHEVAGRLVMIDPYAWMPWYFRLLVTGWLGRFFYATAFENPVGRWLTNLSLARRRTGETDLTASFAQRDHGTTYRYLQVLGELGHASRYPGNRVPTVILHGERTFGAIRRGVQAYAEVWPGTPVIELRGAAHLPIQEATAAVAGVGFGSTPGLAPATPSPERAGVPTAP